MKITINNWLGDIESEVNQEEIDELIVEPYYWDYDESNNTIYSSGNFFSGPYRGLNSFSAEKFVAVSHYNIDDGEVWGDGYEFEFNNCDCPVGLEEYISGGGDDISGGKESSWIFVDENRILIKDDEIKSKFLEAVEADEIEINNSGTGCLRHSDFNCKEFFQKICAEEPDKNK